MRSTTGTYYPALDHLRAGAALMVFCWHFLHFSNGYPVPFGQADTFFPLFPLALLDEGHVGVALFMTLSGYLFAKLLDGQGISYPRFLFNRALRLLPLLLFVIALWQVQTWFSDAPNTPALHIKQGADLIPALCSNTHGAEIKQHLLALAKDLLSPALPNGGWSINVEWHFYLLLPLLLLLARKSLWNMLLVLAGAILFRYLWHREYGAVQHLAYYTIVGRIDQFVLGMLACYLPRKIMHPAMVGLATLAFCMFYWYFDRLGGYMYGSRVNDSLWIILSSVEGFFLAIFIAWYDHHAPCARGRAALWISGFLAKIGEYSYSIYLLHMFFVFHAARLIHEHIMDISRFFIALPWALLCFLLLLPIAKLSYYYVELPFMRWRKPYIIDHMHREKPAGLPDRSVEKRS